MRYYSSIAVDTTLAVSCSAPATTIVVAATTGFPVSFPYTLCIDADTVNKELVEVTAAAGTSLTVVRGVDATSAVSHSLGATVSHDHSARDFRESREHEALTAAHGASGAVVGTTNTQTLTHKDLTDVTNTFPSSLATDAEVATAVAAEATTRAAAITTEANARIAADAGKANVSHTHAESDVTGLVADLAARATLTTAQVLTHKDLTDATNTFPSSLATDAEVTAAFAAVPTWTAWTPTMGANWDTPTDCYYKDHGRGIYTVHGRFQRAVAAGSLTSSSSGNVIDETILGLPAPLVPTATPGTGNVRLGFSITRIAAGQATAPWDGLLTTSGVVQLIAGPVSSTIGTGDSFTFEFTVGV